MPDTAVSARHLARFAPVVALAALAACAGAVPAATPPRPPSVLAALDGRPTLDGQPVAATGRPDVTTTVIVFFATWCTPCRRELALLGELRPRYPGVHILGLNAYEEWGARSDEARMRRFLAESAPWLEVVPRADDLLTHFGGVPKIPTLLVFDRHGVAAAEFRRNLRPPPSLAELEAAIVAASAR